MSTISADKVYEVMQAFENGERIEYMVRNQREVWGRHRLRIIKEIEAFGIAFSKEGREHQSDMVRMKVEPDTFTQIRNHWFDLEKEVEGHQHWFERKQRQPKQMN